MEKERLGLADCYVREIYKLLLKENGCARQENNKIIITHYHRGLELVLWYGIGDGK